MQGGVFPSVGLTADADGHGTPPGLHNCRHSPQRKQMGCQFPTGNSAMLTGLGEECWEGRKHCGLPATHPRAILLEGDAGFVLPTHKFYGLSPEAAKATCGRWGGLGGARHSSLRHPSNEGWLRYLEARVNELWMADHYLLIKTKTQKPDETNKTIQSRDNYNFI